LIMIGEACVSRHRIACSQSHLEGKVDFRTAPST